MEGEHWADAQEQGLQHWLALDSRHPGALLRAQAAWMALDPPRPPLSLSADESKRTIRPSRRSVLAGGGVAIAASIAGGVMLLGGTSYATPVGEIRRVPPADGSIAAINTARAIAVQLDDAARHVRGGGGGGWFPGPGG